ncbi:hypothetical protein A4X06_0g8131 [Tilletia controversa]|uniref:ATP synthase subunit delta, mitochondrial n=1 Tax=Tilletia controversa TaxID=13291 RepID=A0A8X7ML88_9BASI|nr:hypothetical protein CF335_g9337 [Tilletia laevis]KAE8239655.1 hypothetical protein A4X06_0g8131 [Tilletia controversa]
MQFSAHRSHSYTLTEPRRASASAASCTTSALPRPHRIRSAPVVQRRRGLGHSKLDFTPSHQAFYISLDVTQVKIPAASGDMDILAAHVPSVEELKPDLVATRHRSGSATQ